MSVALVLLEPIDRAELDRALAEFAAAVREHVALWHDRDREPRLFGTLDLLREEHRRFLGSLEVLDWLTEIVRRDDHGGNRQALGQYGKILAEALGRHRLLERGFEPPSSGGPPPRRGTAPGQP